VDNFLDIFGSNRILGYEGESNIVQININGNIGSFECDERRVKMGVTKVRKKNGVF
jgi:hypothetical protein